MVFTNYSRYKEAIQHILTNWPNGCGCGVCKAVDKQENIKFGQLKKKVDKK